MLSSPKCINFIPWHRDTGQATQFEGSDCTILSSVPDMKGCTEETGFLQLPQLHLGIGHLVFYILQLIYPILAVVVYVLGIPYGTELPLDPVLASAWAFSSFPTSLSHLALSVAVQSSSFICSEIFNSICSCDTHFQ